MPKRAGCSHLAINQTRLKVKVMNPASYAGALLLCVVALTTTGWPIDPIEIEYLWQSQPSLNFDWQGPPGVPNVYVSAENLNASSANERIKAAQSIVRAPNSRSLDKPAILNALLARLKAGEPDPLVRIELIAAACELDDGAHAQQLWESAQTEPDASAVVERACIRWRNALPLDRWRKVLSKNESTDHELLHAIEGIGATGTNTDVIALQSLALDGTRSAPMRLASARALGQVASDDQMPLAKKLKASSAQYGQLMAIEVLAHTSTSGTTEFVQDIAQHGLPIAQRAAYHWLCKHDMSTAQRLAEEFLKHVDPAIRLAALEQITLAATDSTLPALFAAFHDQNTNVRLAARLHVLTCVDRSDETKQRALALLSEAMQEKEWRALEQAIRLAVELHQISYCDRLMTLLDHERGEICISAGWALRNLAEDEAILHRMLDYVKQFTTQLMSDATGNITEKDFRCCAHLLEAFGHRKFEPAKETALRYVPKVFRLGLITRMAAVWTCGRLWENSENKNLTQELHARIADKNTQFPESPSVRYVATLALGWIADADSRDPLVKWDEFKPTPIGHATEWALKRIDDRSAK